MPGPGQHLVLLRGGARAGRGTSFVFASPPRCPTPFFPLPLASPGLRRRAEQRRLLTQAAGCRVTEGLRRLVQALQLHRLELEMQRGELLLTQTAVQAARAGCVDRYSSAPVGCSSPSPFGAIEQFNLCGEQLPGAGRWQLMRWRFARFMASADRVAFKQFLASAPS